MQRGGLTLSRSRRIIAVFSLTTPGGIVAGAVFTTFLSHQSGELLEAVFDALAAGTFLYIASLDIIGEEFADPTRRWSKIALLCLGLGTMALLALWV